MEKKENNHTKLNIENLTKKLTNSVQIQERIAAKLHIMTLENERLEKICLELKQQLTISEIQSLDHLEQIENLTDENSLMEMVFNALEIEMTRLRGELTEKNKFIEFYKLTIT